MRLATESTLLPSQNDFLKSVTPYTSTTGLGFIMYVYL